MSVGYQNGDRNKRASSAGGTAGAGAGTSGAGDWEAVKDDVAGATADAAHSIGERGREFLSSARDQAADYVDRRKDSAAQSVEDIAHSLRDTGAAFEDRPNIKAFVDSAAQGLEGLADEIRDRSFSEIYSDVEEFARRRPTAFATAAGVAGFLLARFLKSSAEDADYRRYEARRARAYRTDAMRSRQSGT